MLSGGTTECPGFSERLKAELEALVPVPLKVSIIKIDADVVRGHRSNAVFVGGTILATLPSFQSGAMWVRRDEYEEYGAPIVHRKCF